VDGDKTMLKPHGELSEIADVVIRALNWLQYLNTTRVNFENLDYLMGKVSSMIGEEDEERLRKLKPLEIHGVISASALTIANPFESDIDVGAIAGCILICEKYCKIKGWDLWNMVNIKHEYNLTREQRHGGKAL